jgi:hypothetical protein
MENWLYLKLEDELGLCGGLARIDYIAANYVVTDGCAAAVDALRVLSRQQYARDLVQVHVCAKFIPLRRSLVCFDIWDEKRYGPRGQKGFGINLQEAWRKVIEKCSSLSNCIKDVYERVARQVEDLVGPLMRPKIKAIRKALGGHRRVNRCFNILGLGYPDWPTVDLSRSEVGGKRK